MKTKFLLFLMLPLVLTPSVYADDDDEESFLTYDQIVDELNESRVSTPTPKAKDLFSSVKIHAGFGFVSSLLNVSGRDSAFINGTEVNFGIDLFDPEWTAESSFRAFNTQDYASKASRVSLREFDLRVVYRPQLTRNLKLRTGLGVTGRYMKLNSPELSGEYSTPAMVASCGVEAKLTRVFSVGADLGYRTKLIEETIDNSSIEGILKADFQF